jgi:hypothetical protein
MGKEDNRVTAHSDWAARDTSMQLLLTVMPDVSYLLVWRLQVVLHSQQFSLNFLNVGLAV